MRINNIEPKDSICYLAIQAVRKILAYYNRALEPLGLTAQQVMAINVLMREDGLSLGVFAKRAGMGKAAAVTMIKRLERMELVTKKINPEDARLNVLTLTEKAKELCGKIKPISDKIEKSIEETLGVDDVESLIKGLTSIQDLDI